MIKHDNGRRMNYLGILFIICALLFTVTVFFATNWDQDKKRITKSGFINLSLLIFTIIFFIGMTISKKPVEPVKLAQEQSENSQESQEKLQAAQTELERQKAHNEAKNDQIKHLQGMLSDALERIDANKVNPEPEIKENDQDITAEVKENNQDIAKEKPEIKENDQDIVKEKPEIKENDQDIAKDKPELAANPGEEPKTEPEIANPAENDYDSLIHEASTLHAWYGKMPEKLLIEQKSGKIKLYENPEYRQYLKSKPGYKQHELLISYDGYLKKNHNRRHLKPEEWFKVNIPLFNDKVEK